MKVVTARQMREIDRRTIEEYGIPGEVLMAYAGRAVVDEILREYGDLSRVAICAGAGNNGGDGFIIAYLLACRGTAVTVYFVGSVKKMSDAASIYFKLCEKANITIIPVTETLAEQADFHTSDLIIDALFGTGFEGAVHGPAAALIARMNESAVPVLSVDVPSGLPSDGEAPLGPVVRARSTVTIGLPKIATATWPGLEYAGKVTVVSIGFPPELTESDDITASLVDEAFARRMLSSTAVKSDGNKGDNGHLLLAGGFDGMEGAIMMTAMAALEAGVGLVTLLTTPRAREIIAGSIPELITAVLPETRDDLRTFLSSRRYDAMVVGPGMGRSDAAREAFSLIIEEGAGAGMGRVLVDGDGLFHLGEYIREHALPAGMQCLITPHFMEAARIMQCPVEDIAGNRFRAACELVSLTGCVSLLKGPRSIIAYKGGTLINTTGNASMATAGSGDILSGIIGSLLLRDMPLPEAAALGAWIHGRAGDMHAEVTGDRLMKATDMVSFIREAMRLDS